MPTNRRSVSLFKVYSVFMETEFPNEDELDDDVV